MAQQKKIERLTPEQEAQLPVYRAKWIKIGLDTQPCDRIEAKKWIAEAYRTGGFEPPKFTIWVGSPLGCFYTLFLLRSWRNKKSAGVRAGVVDGVRDGVVDGVRAGVVDGVRDGVVAGVVDGVRDGVVDGVVDGVRAGVLDDGVLAGWNNLCYGSYEAAWLSFYSFFMEQCRLECTQRLRPLMELAKNCGWWFPYRDVVICSEKPSEIHQKLNRLHRDGGPAVLYSDGFAVWSLNGIRVSQQFAETPGNQMPLDWWLNEKNVEVRGQIERKIGTPRILRELNASQIHAEIVTIGGRDLPYAVIELTLKNGDRRRLLEMENPSTGETHREWIPPEITTVREALAWRNGTEELPAIIT